MLHTRSIWKRSECAYVCACDTFILWGSAKVALGPYSGFHLHWHRISWAALVFHKIALCEQHCVQSCPNIWLSGFENVQLFYITRGIQNHKGGLRADPVHISHTSVEKFNYWICCSCPWQRKCIGSVIRTWQRGYVRIRPEMVDSLTTVRADSTL